MGSNIDAMITAGLRPLAPFDAATRYSNLQDMALQRQAMQQRAAYEGQLAQLANMRMQGMQREQADDQAVQDALGKTNGDLGQALPQLAGRIGGDRFNDLTQKWLGQQREKLQNTKDQNAIQDTYHEGMGALANGIKHAGYTPASFDAATNLAIGLHPEMRGLLQPYIDKAHQDPSSIQGMADQWIAETAQGRAGEEEVRRQAQEARVRGLYPSTLSKAESEATEAQQKVEGTTPLTRAQQMQFAIDQNRDLETQWYHRKLIEQGDQRLNQGGEGDDGETPNSRATTRRLQMKQLDGLIDQEADLHKLRLLLGNAIGTGAIYVDQKGKSGPLSTEENVKQAQLQEMRVRLQEATDEVNGVIARKNALGQQLGIEPRVSTEQARGAVNRGARPQASPQAAPGAQASPRQGGGKQLDRATGEQLLREAGATDPTRATPQQKARARALAQQRGYQF